MKKPKLNWEAIDKIPKMTEEELDKNIEKKSKQAGWKDA